MTNTQYRKLADACYYMGTHGGYVLAFATSQAAANPALTWSEFRQVLLANGHGFCDYAESVVLSAFERGKR